MTPAKDSVTKKRKAGDLSASLPPSFPRMASPVSVPAAASVFSVSQRRGLTIADNLPGLMAGGSAGVIAPVHLPVFPYAAPGSLGEEMGSGLGGSESSPFVSEHSPLPSLSGGGTVGLEEGEAVFGRESISRFYKMMADVVDGGTPLSAPQYRALVVSLDDLARMLEFSSYQKKLVQDYFSEQPRFLELWHHFISFFLSFRGEEANSFHQALCVMNLFVQLDIMPESSVFLPLVQKLNAGRSAPLSFLDLRRILVPIEFFSQKSKENTVAHLVPWWFEQLHLTLSLLGSIPEAELDLFIPFFINNNSEVVSPRVKKIFIDRVLSTLEGTELSVDGFLGVLVSAQPLILDIIKDKDASDRLFKNKNRWMRFLLAQSQEELSTFIMNLPEEKMLYLFWLFFEIKPPLMNRGFDELIKKFPQKISDLSLKVILRELTEKWKLAPTLENKAFIQDFILKLVSFYEASSVSFKLYQATDIISLGFLVEAFEADILKDFVTDWLSEVQRRSSFNYVHAVKIFSNIQKIMPTHDILGKNSNFSKALLYNRAVDKQEGLSSNPVKILLPLNSLDLYEILDLISIVFNDKMDLKHVFFNHLFASMDSSIDSASDELLFSYVFFFGRAPKEMKDISFYGGAHSLLEHLARVLEQRIHASGRPLRGDSSYHSFPQLSFFFKIRKMPPSVLFSRFLPEGEAVSIEEALTFLSSFMELVRSAPVFAKNPMISDFVKLKKEQFQNNLRAHSVDIPGGDSSEAVQLVLNRIILLAESELTPSHSLLSALNFSTIPDTKALDVLYKLIKVQKNKKYLHLRDNIVMTDFIQFARQNIRARSFSESLAETLEPRDFFETVIGKMLDCGVLPSQAILEHYFHLSMGISDEKISLELYNLFLSHIRVSPYSGKEEYIERFIQMFKHELQQKLITSSAAILSSSKPSDSSANTKKVWAKIFYYITKGIIPPVEIISLLLAYPDQNIIREHFKSLLGDFSARESFLLESNGEVRGFLDAVKEALMRTPSSSSASASSVSPPETHTILIGHIGSFVRAGLTPPATLFYQLFSVSSSNQEFLESSSSLLVALKKFPSFRKSEEIKAFIKDNFVPSVISRFSTPTKNFKVPTIFATLEILLQIGIVPDLALLSLVEKISSSSLAVNVGRLKRILSLMEQYPILKENPIIQGWVEELRASLQKAPISLFLWDKSSQAPFQGRADLFLENSLFLVEANVVPAEANFFYFMLEAISEISSKLEENKKNYLIKALFLIAHFGSKYRDFSSLEIQSASLKNINELVEGVALLVESTQEADSLSARELKQILTAIYALRAQDLTSYDSVKLPRILSAIDPELKETVLFRSVSASISHDKIAERIAGLCGEDPSDLEVEASLLSIKGERMIPIKILSSGKKIMVILDGLVATSSLKASLLSLSPLEDVTLKKEGYAKVIHIPYAEWIKFEGVACMVDDVE